MKRIKIISIFLLSMLCTIGHAQVNGQLKIDKSEIRSERANEFDKLDWKSDYKTPSGRGMVV